MGWQAKCGPLRLRLGLQLDLSAIEFYGEFDVLAAVLLADFFENFSLAHG